MVVYLPVRAAPAARVGSGAGPAARSNARGRPVVQVKRGSNVSKVPASAPSKQVVREKRGGTPSKKKR